MHRYPTECVGLVASTGVETLSAQTKATWYIGAQNQYTNFKIRNQTETPVKMNTVGALHGVTIVYNVM